MDRYGAGLGTLATVWFTAVRLALRPCGDDVATSRIQISQS